MCLAKPTILIPGMLSGNRGGWMASPHHHLGAIWSESAGQNPAGQNPHVWQPLPQGGSSGGGGRYAQTHFNGPPRPTPRSGALTIEAPPEKSQPQTATQPQAQALDESDGVGTAKSEVGAPDVSIESEAAKADAAHSKPAAGRPPSQQADQVTGVTYAGRSSTPPDTPAVPAAASPVAPAAPSAAAPTSPERAAIAERPQTSSAPLGSRVAARGPQGARAQTTSTSTTASTTAGAEPAQRAPLNLPPGLSGPPPPTSTMGAEEGKKATGPVQLMPPNLTQLWRD